MKMEVDFEGEGDWKKRYKAGQMETLRQMLRYVVAKMGADAEEELELLKTEREQVEAGWI